MRILICLILLSISLVYSSRILVIPAHGAASHTKSMYPIADVLAKHGHTVVVFQIVKSDKSKAKAPAKSKVQDRYLEMAMTEKEKNMSFRLPADMVWAKSVLMSMGLVFPWSMLTDICKQMLDNVTSMNEFEQVMNEGWDLVLVDDIFTPCGMLASKYARSSNASIINFGTTILMPKSQQVRGIPINNGLFPPPLRALPGAYEHRNFLERAHNVIDAALFESMAIALDFLVPHWLGLPRTEYTMPSSFALTSDLLMCSVSPMLEMVKPMSNDVIELDTDCPPKDVLPDKYKKFVDDPGSKGTIIFAMGHVIAWDDAPKQVLHAFLDAFSSLTDYRIVWQYQSDKEKPVTPEHVLLEKWLPQSGLLYHTKTKLFISHVGGKSLREAICAGVPVVTMPIFAEQYRNTALANRKGISTFIDKTQLTPEIIRDAIIETITNSTYSKNAQALQKQLDDRIIKPMELGRFWSEYLLRHKNTSIQRYLRMNASKLSWLVTDGVDLTFVSIASLLGLVIVAM